MKKYQLWLERKSYSQHLFNLMKIKQSHKQSSLQKWEPSQSKTPKGHPGREQGSISRYKQMEEYHGDADKLGDISYAITYKQLKNRKLRIMKTFEILNQNMSMARRIKNVKSVFSSTLKDKTNSEHSNKRRIFEKKCEQSNQELREENFKKFKKWQNFKSNQLNKYHFTISVESISKIMGSQAEYAAAWCEISTEKGFVRSDLVHLDEFQGHRFLFALDQEMPKDSLLRIYVCKGLQSNFIGQIQFRRPNLNQLLMSTHRSDDGQFEVTLNQKYQKLKKERPTFNIK